MLQEEANVHEPESLIPEEHESFHKRMYKMIAEALSIFSAGSMDETKHKYMVAVITIFSVGLGVTAGYLPPGAGWRLFSWHPLCMTIGFVGLMGSATVTKRLGGYTNTKLHAGLASLGLFSALGGFYAIYHNKDLHGKDHFTSYHSWYGLFALFGSIVPMLVGLVFLHPDFGIDKRNQKIRKAHKYFARLVIIVAWLNCILGVYKLTDDLMIQLMYGMPVFCLLPFTLF